MDSQINNLSNVTALGDLVFSNYRGKVQPWLEHMGPVLSLFNAAGPGDFSLTGKDLKFARDVSFIADAMATSGELPDHSEFNPVVFTTTPAQVYVRRAVANFTVARAQGDGTFEDYLGRIMRQLWDSLERTQNRHVHGSSNGYLALGATRTSSTVFTIKDGYGFTGANPAMFLRPGTRIAWLDASNSYVVGGVGVISAYAPSTKTVTMAAAWENGAGAGGAQFAANDPIVLATTTSESASYFTTEFGLAPLGLLDLIDPAQASSTYLGVSETANPSIKPQIQASVAFGEDEVMEFAAAIEAKSGKPVTQDSHVFTCQKGVEIALAKTLTPYTQIATKGSTLTGGWTGVQLGSLPELFTDPYHVPDTLYAMYKEGMHKIDLDGDARLFAGDGSEWQRLADFDGKEVFAYHYIQRIIDNRNCFGALTGISTTNADNYAADGYSL